MLCHNSQNISYSGDPVVGLCLNFHAKLCHIFINVIKFTYSTSNTFTIENLINKDYSI